MTGNPLYTGGQVLCRIFTTLWFDLHVRGVENVPREGGVLIVANHQSLLDPVLVGVRLPRPTSYLAKSELFENRFFGWLIRNLYAFPVRQGEGDVGAVREAIRRLQDGNALVLFPEGTRTENGELTPIEGGVGLIVRKAGVPVVPCVIEGSYAAWPKGRKLFHPGEIDVRFGTPMRFDGMKAGQIVQSIDKAFHDMLAELREERRAVGR
jgi:1-acyl-sn-glycerol-3-phosphate acyltransferase